MIFFLATVTTPPLILIGSIYIVLLGIILLGALLAMLNIGGHPLLIGAIALMPLLACLVLLWRRQISRRRLLVLWPITKKIGHLAGPKGAGLLTLIEAGLPTPAGFIIPQRSLSRIREEMTRHGRSRLLKILCRNLSSAAGRAGVRRYIVRSSFEAEDAEFSMPGVFDSLPDIPALDPGRIGEAILAVMNSMKGEAARAYLSRLERDIEEKGAILVQEDMGQDSVGLIASADPENNRPDEMRIEMTLNGVFQLGHYNRVQGSLRGSAELIQLLSKDMLKLLLSAVAAGERSLGTTVIIEFGIKEGNVFFYQLRGRRQPTREVWINSGELELNVEAMPPLHRDLCFGDRLSFLSSYINIRSGSGNINLRLFDSRPYASLNDLLAVRRKHGSSAVPIRTIFAAKIDSTAGLPDRYRTHPAIMAFRQLLLKQAAAKRGAARWRRWSQYCEDLSAAAHFHPLIAWNTHLAHILSRLAGNDLRRVETMHLQIVKRLSEIAGNLLAEAGNPACGEQLRLEELSILQKGGKLPETEELKRRAEIFKEDSERPAIAIRPPIPKEAENTSGQAHSRLMALSPGCAKAVMFMPKSKNDPPPNEAYILAPPDMSLHWLRLLTGASGAVFTARSCLSHLALQAVELKLPALAGADSENLKELDACMVELDAGAGTIGRPR